MKCKVLFVRSHVMMKSKVLFVGARVLMKCKVLFVSVVADWDNVGLLVEPAPPKYISKIMLTNDLTVPVLEEAKNKTVDLIISYHPPIFQPLKRLSQNSWKERILVDCIENRIAVFSPHTSHDALQGGVNDWLLSAFGRYEL